MHNFVEGGKFMLISPTLERFQQSSINNLSKDNAVQFCRSCDNSCCFYMNSV